MSKFFLKLMVITCGVMISLTLAGRAGGRWFPVHTLSYYQENVGIGLIDVNRRLSGWLVADPTVENAGQWSPDGGKLAYVARSGQIDQNNNDIFILDVDSWTVQNISQSRADDMLPLWSPDGSLLAYATQEIYADEFLRRRLWIQVIDVDGEQILERFPQTKGLNLPQTWSPDGRMLAFVSVAETANTQIHVVDMQTGAPVPRFMQTQGSPSAHRGRPMDAGSPSPSWRRKIRLSTL